MASVRDLQKATLRAREATGNRGIGTRAAGGQLQIIHVSYGGRGRSTVREISDWLPLDQAVAYLDNMAEAARQGTTDGGFERRRLHNILAVQSRKVWKESEVWEAIRYARIGIRY